MPGHSHLWKPKYTSINALTAGGVLLVIQAVRPNTQPADWAVVSVEIAFIVLISLLVNGVSNMAVHPEKSPDAE